MNSRHGVLITGGSGFLGHALVERLFAEGCERICIFSRGEFPQARMRATFKDDTRLRWFIGDVRDVDRLTRAMQSVPLVIHAAALKRIEVGAQNPEEMIKTNVLGSVNTIEAARRAGVEKVVLVSSDKAFEPVSPYGQSKALAESLFLTSNDPQYGPKFSVARYGNVAGSTGSLIPTWRARIAAGEVVKVTNPECTRFWMTREQAAALVVETLNTPMRGELAVPELPAFRVGDMAEAMGARHEVVGLGAFEKLHESMQAGNSSDKARRMDVDELRAALKGVV